MRSHVVQAAVRPQHESGIRMVPSVTVTPGVLNDDDRLPGSGEVAPLGRTLRTPDFRVVLSKARGVPLLVNAFVQRGALALRPMTDTLDLPNL